MTEARKHYAAEQNVAILRRHLRRVLATDYGESVYEQLYTGTAQLEQSLKDPVHGAEEVWG